MLHFIKGLVNVGAAILVIFLKKQNYPVITSSYKYWKFALSLAAALKLLKVGWSTGEWKCSLLFTVCSVICPAVCLASPVEQVHFARSITVLQGEVWKCIVGEFSASFLQARHLLGFSVFDNFLARETSLQEARCKFLLGRQANKHML